ncbi:MAG: hypothetical protein ACOVMN_11985 [Flexibacteraceae bacterium]
MGLFFTETAKKLLFLRNEMFKEVGIPELKRNGFIKAVFSSINFGRNNLGDFTYNITRLSDGNLEYLTIHICRGDKSIQVYLNIFELFPKPNSIDDLVGVDGIQFLLSPNNRKEFLLRSDEYKGPPIFYSFHPEHKIGTYYTRSGLDKEVLKLRNLIKKDMSNIDYFVKKWHEVHIPNKTDWEGNILE